MGAAFPSAKLYFRRKTAKRALHIVSSCRASTVHQSTRHCLILAKVCDREVCKENKRKLILLVFDSPPSPFKYWEKTLYCWMFVSLPVPVKTLEVRSQCFGCTGLGILSASVQNSVKASLQKPFLTFSSPLATRISPLLTEEATTVRS